MGEKNTNKQMLALLDPFGWRCSLHSYDMEMLFGCLYFSCKITSIQKFSFHSYFLLLNSSSTFSDVFRHTIERVMLFCATISWRTTNKEAQRPEFEGGAP